MEEIIEALGKMDGKEFDDTKERAEQIFVMLDTNNDGMVEEEEFVKGCMQDQELITCLNVA